jgi:hypothetical protein
MAPRTKSNLLKIRVEARRQAEAEARTRRHHHLLRRKKGEDKE